MVEPTLSKKCFGGESSEDTDMNDDTVKVINSEYSPLGEMGQKYLVSGKNVSNENLGRYPPRAPSNLQLSIIAQTETMLDC
jgi:hypothetical protein